MIKGKQEIRGKGDYQKQILHVGCAWFFLK
jgi:hypothetical protein